MKGYRALSLILTAAVLCSCDSNVSADGGSATAKGANAVSPTATLTDEELSEYYKPFEGDYSEDLDYVFETPSNARMDVADDGRVVLAVPKINGGGVNFIEYALDGTSRRIGDMQGYPDTIAFMGDELYFTKVKWVGDNVSGGVLLFKFNAETKESKLFAELDIPLTYCSGMSGNKDEMYIFGDDPSNDKDLVCDYHNPPSNNHSVYCYKNGEALKVPVDFVTTVCAIQSGGALISACDDEGYYIIRYKDGELYDKIYTYNSGEITGMADVDGRRIIYTVYTTANRLMLCAADLNNMYNAELIPDAFTYHELFSKGGLCFYQDGVDKENGTCTLHRVQFSAHFKDNVPMKLITTHRSYQTPFGCGYTIDINNYSEEEAALKILSQDKDFDICYISTGAAVSYSMKEKGSFYPLNDVKGVSDYLDKCFPSIKEAFTNESGEIWALPIWANNKYMIKNVGDADFSAMKLTEFVDFIDGLSSEDFGNTMCFPGSYVDVIMSQYVSTHDSFDTPEFRAAAEKLKNSKRLNPKAENDEKWGNLNNEELLVALAVTITDVIKTGDYTVSGVPCIDDCNAVVPEVMFLCVNPSSEHLADALDYIAKIAEFQRTNPDQFVLTYENGAYSGGDTVKQMTDLCADAEVRFTYPYELYDDDFYKYLAGDITLDSFIKEADRKLRVYLNE